MEYLKHIDEYLFHLINETWVSPWADTILSFMRNQYVWGPLYVFLIGFLIFNFGKKGLYFILMIILTVFTSNLISSELIKKNVKRQRPCNQMALEGHRRLLVHCGTGYSFTSSHASNHFSISMFIVLAGASFLGKIRYLFLLWAGSIAYAQVYVGVHFPFDVLVGAMIGGLIGWITYLLYHKMVAVR